jgi:hypothetical protein
MDPTIEALTIHPAAWAALIEGLAEGVAYGSAMVASVLVVAVVLAVSLGGRGEAEEAGVRVAETAARRRRRACRRLSA